MKYGVFFAYRYNQVVRFCFLGWWYEFSNQYDTSGSVRPLQRKALSYNFRERRIPSSSNERWKGKYFKYNHDTILFIFSHVLDELYTNFKEATIDFPPTYKYDLRCNDGYAKHRTPSYTVRTSFGKNEATRYNQKRRLFHSN